MQEIDHPPDAPSLLESMRSIGYSVESALADIVDNSLSAGANHVWIEFRPQPEPYIAVLDDGKGMSRDELALAMRHGSTDPRANRAEADLGRYGLGLKTASLSQCRRLTVASWKNGKLSAFRWDLDLIQQRKSWTLLSLDTQDMKGIPHLDQLQKLPSGTLVVWQELDRMLAGESSAELALGRLMSVAADHLALVFHRYVAGEPRHKPVELRVNNRQLAPVDPFLLDHRATQPLAEDSFNVEGKRVTVKPFILPHLSKLSAADVGRAGGSEGLRHQQGFYVYRNRRLIIWGTWFRLAKKDELSKLARVRVDIPNSLDHLWTIDVKKSTAVPPEQVRVNLRRTIERIRQASGRTLVYRGRQVNAPLAAPGWNEISTREGVRFDVNREHPVVQSFRAGLSQAQQAAFESTLRVLEQSFPADALYARLASDQRHQRFDSDIEVSYRATLAQILDGWSAGPEAREGLLRNLHLIEPFSVHPQAARKIAEEWLQETDKDEPVR